MMLAAQVAGTEAILPGAATNFLVILGQLISLGATIYAWIIIIRVLLTWINPNPYTPAMRFLSRLADPVLNRARRWFPLTLGGLDFSPILAIIGIQVLGDILGQWVISLGHGYPFIMLVPLIAMGLIRLLNSIAWLLVVIMAIRFIMSLVHPSPYNIIVQVIYGMTEPLLAPLRRFFPPGPKGMDWRPLVFLLITLLIQWVVIASLFKAAVVWVNTIVGAAG